LWGEEIGDGCVFWIGWNLFFNLVFLKNGFCPEFVEFGVCVRGKKQKKLSSNKSQSKYLLKKQIIRFVWYGLGMLCFRFWYAMKKI
jgi:hypothetical protein